GHTLRCTSRRWRGGAGPSGVQEERESAERLLSFPQTERERDGSPDVPRPVRSRPEGPPGEEPITAGSAYRSEEEEEDERPGEFRVPAIHLPGEPDPLHVRRAGRGGSVCPATGPRTGFGLLLLIDLIHLLSPSHIVQMVTEGGERMEPLTPEYVKSAAGYMTKASSDTKYKNQGLDSSDEEEDSDLHFRPSLGHELLQVENSYSGAGGTETVRHGWILRDLTMLGYIGKLQQFEQIIPLNSFVPYEVPFNAVALRVIHADVAPPHILYTANASWVGLCHILDDVGSQSSGPVILTQTPVCDCLGFGIIRGINMEKKVYHILTPIPPAALRLETYLYPTASSRTRRCHGWILRDLGMLGYIGKLQQFEQIIPLNSFVPYEVLFGELTWRKRVYHILTPIPPAALRLVNCLQIGNISIPHSIFRNQPGINGEIPYVTSDYDFTIYGSGKMKRKKHLKRRQHL
ncbi:polynucleotide 5'-hydroxyl-kinase NOL9-like, partial [Aquarana catesbeiana]|uniref:polynucleotide 5'-hydroxyl-kinase NOL9-like n=1 Tax=Aquarana catesbeiana TaxID=8400 RepID=UPI003CCA312F